MIQNAFYSKAKVDNARLIRPTLPRSRTRPDQAPDVTLINLNLMLARQDGTFDQQCYIPLGPLSIAAVLERHGYCVEFIDYQVFSHARYFDAEMFLDAVGDLPSVVGISCMSNLLPFAVLVARTIKQRHAGVFVVLGGVGPSPVARELVAAFDFIDCVVEGEGELPMLDILRGKRDRLPQAHIVKDLDELPVPAYSHIDFSIYDAAPSIVTSRGCPYDCTFCTEPYNFAHTVRFRDVKAVIDEIAIVHGMSGRTMFLFQDDILPIKPSRFRRLLDGLTTLPLPIQWKCFSRTDLMNEALMRQMAAAGCVQIRYGIESGSNRTLRAIRKGFEIEAAYRVAAQSVEHFPSVHCSFMWGFPFETAEDVEETLAWLARFEAAGVTCLLFQYSPLPGSPIYRSSNQRPLLFDRSKYSIFVLSGHENIRQLQFEPAADSDELYDVVSRHPEVFSGFYHYDDALVADMRNLVQGYEIRHRTPLRNEYDL
jgi:anaerobic magnesium-protoporphyrin IX monomethyl ester cyclase